MKKIKLIDVDESLQIEGIIKRHAVRAIILDEKNLLVIQTNKGDLKFPGGGIEGQETHEEALKREVLEETGYSGAALTELFCHYVEQKADEYVKNHLYESNSYYYFATIKRDDVVDLQLDAYEKELDFKARWVTVEDAIRINGEAACMENCNPWVERELHILLLLNQFLKST